VRRSAESITTIQCYDRLFGTWATPPTQFRVSRLHFIHAENATLKDLLDLPVPMPTDAKRELSNALDIPHHEDCVNLRSTFIVSPEGIIRWVNVNDLDVRHGAPKTLRVLEALQMSEMTTCNREPDQDVLER
jgi:alkyl hydroperoxide reductase subunit AhpC